MSDTFERIVGKICLDRGWVGQELIAGCLDEAARAGRKLSEVLVDRGLVTPGLMEELRRAVEKVIAPAPDAANRRKEDSLLGRILVSSGGATGKQVAEALRIRRYYENRLGYAPPLQQILLERGLAPFEAVRKALRLLRNRTLLECRGCRQRFWAMGYEPAKRYRCAACGGDLGRWGAAPDVPEEVRRAADNPVNLMGKYVAVQAVGRGGMGVVYRGWDTALRRWAALKILTAGVTPEDVSRFWREAQLVAALRHPAIVNVYDIFSDGGRHVIAMEFIDGHSMAGKRFPPGEAVRIVGEVARALEHAHARGVIHRDIKPHNILLDRAGKPYLTDFGLAKQVRAASSSWTSGTVIGTPMYMSPEQAQGRSEEIDARTDVYSLGAVLYEALTGRPPFLGSDAYDTLRRVIQDPVVPPSGLRPEVPPSIERVVLRCLEKDRERRYAGARELAGDLERCLAGPGPAARKTSRRFVAGSRPRHGSTARLPRVPRRPPPGKEPGSGPQ